MVLGCIDYGLVCYVEQGGIILICGMLNIEEACGNGNGNANGNGNWNVNGNGILCEYAGIE